MGHTAQEQPSGNARIRLRELPRLRPAAVHDAINYPIENADRTQYASAIGAGLPIGSGAVEATWKTFVNQRMKRSRSCWKTTTGEPGIHLRAMALGDRWDDAAAAHAAIASG